MQPRDHGDTARHVAFADELGRWIQRAGVSDSDAIADLAVGMADILNASARAACELEAMLRLDPTTASGADAALTRIGYLHALYLTEILEHAQELARRWPLLEEAVAARVPDEE
jgi:hypothetical protein